jgi:hypothetical protein
MRPSLLQLALPPDGGGTGADGSLRLAPSIHANIDNRIASSTDMSIGYAQSRGTNTV